MFPRKALTCAAESGSISREEKTGERKGTFFKRDETKKIAVSGFRCTLCGYVELYAKEK